MRYLIRFSYDGTLFYGYQKQKGKRTIQEEIEKALTFINGGIFVTLSSSGRTDKGVHALGQMAHFDLSKKVSLYKLKCGINSNLPTDIHVISVDEVDDSFHARYMVKSKEYVYKLNMGEYNPIDRNYVYQYCKVLDVSKMNEAIKCFIGRHDFKAFTPNDEIRSNYIREVMEAYIVVKDDILEFHFVADGFIKYQIRNMVGALIQVGSLGKDICYINEVLSSCDRHNFYKTAPAMGLYLVDVRYK